MAPTHCFVFANPNYLVPVNASSDSRTDPKYDQLAIQLFFTCCVSAALDGGIVLYSFCFRAKRSSLALFTSVSHT
jgi:hypothetical protein